MIKREELVVPGSCLNKAKDHEMLFVLLGRDPAAPEAIRLWCERRVAYGLNKAEDPQIEEALNAAKAMDAQRGDIRADIRRYKIIPECPTCDHGKMIEGRCDACGFRYP
jgi:hypothetical protein